MAFGVAGALLWAAASAVLLGVAAVGQPCSSQGTAAAVACSALYSQCTGSDGTAGIDGYVAGALEVSPERALLCYCGLEKCLEVAEYCSDMEMALDIALRDLDARGQVQPTCDGDSVLDISKQYSLDTGLRTCSESEVNKLAACALSYKACLTNAGVSSGAYDSLTIVQYLDVSACYCSLTQVCAAEIPCQAVQDQLDTKALPVPKGSTCNTVQDLPIFSLQTFLDGVGSGPAAMTVPDLSSAIDDWKMYAAGCIELSTGCMAAASTCLADFDYSVPTGELLVARNINATTGPCYCDLVSCLSAKAATVCQPLLEVTSIAIQDTLASKAFSCMSQSTQVPTAQSAGPDEIFTLSTSFALHPPLPTWQSLASLLVVFIAAALCLFC